MSGAIRAEQIRIAARKERRPGSRRRSQGIVADVIFEGERIVYEVAVPALGGAVMRVFDHDPEEHQLRPGASLPGLESRETCVFFRKVNLEFKQRRTNNGT